MTLPTLLFADPAGGKVKKRALLLTDRFTTQKIHSKLTDKQKNPNLSTTNNRTPTQASDRPHSRFRGRSSQHSSQRLNQGNVSIGRMARGMDRASRARFRSIRLAEHSKGELSKGQALSSGKLQSPYGHINSLGNSAVNSSAKGSNELIRSAHVGGHIISN